MLNERFGGSDSLPLTDSPKLATALARPPPPPYPKVDTFLNKIADINRIRIPLETLRPLAPHLQPRTIVGKQYHQYTSTSTSGVSTLHYRPITVAPRASVGNRPQLIQIPGTNQFLQIPVPAQQTTPNGPPSKFIVVMNPNQQTSLVGPTIPPIIRSQTNPNLPSLQHIGSFTRKQSKIPINSQPIINLLICVYSYNNISL